MTDEKRKEILRHTQDELQYVLDHARFMETFITNVIEELPETRALSSEIRSEYEHLFNEEYKHETASLAVFALMLLDANAGKSGVSKRKGSA